MLPILKMTWNVKKLACSSVVFRCDEYVAKSGFFNFIAQVRKGEFSSGKICVQEWIWMMTWFFVSLFEITLLCWYVTENMYIPGSACLNAHKSIVPFDIVPSVDVRDRSIGLLDCEIRELICLINLCLHKTELHSGGYSTENKISKIPFVVSISIWHSVMLFLEQ